MKETKWQNPKGDTGDPNMVPSWSKKAQNIATALLRAIPNLPCHANWSIIQTRKQEKDESDFKVHLEALSLWHSGFHTIEEVPQPALAALSVNGLYPEIRGLIKRQKKKK